MLQFVNVCTNKVNPPSDDDMGEGHSQGNQAELGIESVRHGTVMEDMSAEPSSYMDDYKLPVHREKLLEKKFKHPRDANIVFYEKPHIYTINGRFIDASVSGLIKPYAEEFDADKIIQKMMSSKREAWPRLKYCVGATKLSKLSNISLDGNVAVIDKNEVTVYSGSVTELSSKYCTASDRYSFFSYDRGMTPNEIKETWDSPEARNRGTEAHYMMELWMNSEPCRLSQPEVKGGLDFVRKQLLTNNIKAYRTEWEIYGEEENIAGSVDFVGSFPDGSLVIVDWKRSDKLDTHMVDHWNKKLQWPFTHLDDCDGAKYAIQLSSYAWIIEKYYGKTVKALALCSLHPNLPFHTWIPYLRDEVEVLMKKCRERFSCKLALEYLNTTLPRCPLTGNIAFDAVRLSDGKICSEKAILIKDDETIQYTIDHDTRSQCKQELLNVSIAEPCKETRDLQMSAVSWKKRMPSSGIQDIFFN